MCVCGGGAAGWGMSAVEVSACGALAPASPFSLSHSTLSSSPGPLCSLPLCRPHWFCREWRRWRVLNECNMLCGAMGRMDSIDETESAERHRILNRQAESSRVRSPLLKHDSKRYCSLLAMERGEDERAFCTAPASLSATAASRRSSAAAISSGVGSRAAAKSAAVNRGYVGGQPQQWF
jgi:hypothetical protein